jgi:hypothetical protein
MTAPTISATSALSVLISTAKATASETQQIEMQNISNDLQNQLTRQVAALQAPVDQVSINYSQSQIANLLTQQKAVTSLQTQFGSNANILSDMLSQITTMTSAATNGDSTGFDNALSAANTDLTDLTPTAYNPIFTSDGVGLLKKNGLGVNSSASYDLSTPAGQTAASADVAAAQSLVNGIFKITTANQTLAGSQVTALNGQINALQTIENQAQNANATSVATQTAQLQTNMQNQLHLIQLSMGNSSEIATMLAAAENPPGPVTSVFGALSASATAVATEGTANSTSTAPQAPAIMSLFA